MSQLRKQLDVPYTLADGSKMETISLADSISGLLLVKLNTKQYALSWAQFSSAELFLAASGDDGAVDDRIELKFSRHTVTLHGRNLGKLMENITKRRIFRVSESPERYLMTDFVRNMNGEIVTRIDVVVKPR